MRGKRTSCSLHQLDIRRPKSDQAITHYLRPTPSPSTCLLCPPKQLKRWPSNDGQLKCTPLRPNRPKLDRLEFGKLFIFDSLNPALRSLNARCEIPLHFLLTN